MVEKLCEIIKIVLSLFSRKREITFSSVTPSKALVATSALDGVTEEKVISRLRENNDKTIFIISHNFSTIKNCDKIIYFEEGKIVKQGSFKDLMEIPNFKKLSEVS